MRLRRLNVRLAVDENVAGNSWLDNSDLRPTPDKIRTWGFWSYSFFWFSAAATLANWYSPSAFMKSGLTAWEAATVHLAGQFLAGCTMVFSGRPGAVSSIGFPVLARSSFGIVGAIWPVINRAVMSIIWNGINVVQAGQCFYVMLHSITKNITTLPNVMSEEDALNSGGLIGFFIAWIIMMGMCFLTIPKLKYLLYVKLVVFAISSIAMLAWTITRSGMEVIDHPEVESQKETKAWLIVKFTFLSWANCSTFIVNAADFQRYAKKANDVILGQVVGFPIGNFIIAIAGIFVAQTSAAEYGEVIWNPVLYLDRILDEYTPANRAGCFFLALLFAYSCLFSCIYENILPAGNDLAALWPKYINVRRGFLLCGLLSVACVPWKLLGSATNFISWLSAYQIFLSAISGVMICHYYFIINRKLHVPELYRVKDSRYWYNGGVNWRAYAAYLLGIAPNFYGFLGNVGMKITLAGERFYYFAFPIGFVVSLVLFYFFTKRWPPSEPSSLSSSTSLYGEEEKEKQPSSLPTRSASSYSSSKECEKAQT